MANSKVPRSDQGVLASFRQVREPIGRHSKGWAVLSGIERGPAGADPAKTLVRQGGPRMRSEGGGLGDSFSFCVNGFTCTAFEDPCDDYRSSLKFMALRAGNHCSVKFQPLALLARFKGPEGIPVEGEAYALDLLHPSTGETALSVGTDYSDDYYPRFIGAHDPEVLERAKALDLILADDLEACLPRGSAASAKRM